MVLMSMGIGLDGGLLSNFASSPDEQIVAAILIIATARFVLDAWMISGYIDDGDCVGYRYPPVQLLLTPALAAAIFPIRVKNGEYNCE
jgi:hypothetical protein